MKYVSHGWVAVASVAWLGIFLLALQLIPASVWLEVRNIHVYNGIYGQPILMTVDREIVRPFLGSYTVTLKKWDGGWVIDCYVARTLNYKPGNKLPVKLTLDWWTDGVCGDLQPGKWSLTTTWTIHAAGYLPSKTVTVESDPFLIAAHE